MGGSKLSLQPTAPRATGKAFAAIKKPAETAKVSEDVARAWLNKQTIGQIYLTTPQHISRPKFNVYDPNQVHQADILFLSHDRRCKEAEPLTSKVSAEVGSALSSKDHCNAPNSCSSILGLRS